MSDPGWYPDPWAHAPLRWWDGIQWTSHTTEPSEPVASAGAILDRLLRDADRLAVVDVETTGFTNTDRIVEIAVVTMDRDGTVVDEFETLLDPQRDVGATWVHRITPSMVAGAPAFEDVAQHVAARLDGAVFVAHNLPFDRRMIHNEFTRARIGVDWGDGLDTLRATGCKLHVACSEYGIPLDEAHRALADARATARLLCAVADVFDSPTSPVTTGQWQPGPLHIRTREGFTSVQVPQPAVAALTRGVHASVDVAPYVDLLDRAVADLQLTDAEIEELHDLADELGLDDESRRRAHREFLNGLIDASLEDGVVTTDEHDVLCRIASLLAIDQAVVDDRTTAFRSSTSMIHLDSGQQVCFTGAAIDGNGQPIERSELERLAAAHDLIVSRSVTKRGRTLLVAADPASRSTKVRTARRHGLPVTSIADFLSAIAGDGRIEVQVIDTSAHVGVVCQECGTTWTAPAGIDHALCEDCQPAPVTPEPVVQVDAPPPVVETLTCSECGSDWQRNRTRGRKPLRCPDCS